jgi:PIN domain nuclease of toxin-antitoxin system
LKYLLDTSVFLWSLDQFERLNAEAQALLLSASGSDELYLSSVSSWEISIKAGIGKLKLPEPPVQYVPKFGHCRSHTPTRSPSVVCRGITMTRLIGC